MSLAAGTAAFETERAAAGSAYIRSRAAALLNVLVALWVFSGGFVLTEPAPYEVLFLLVLPVALMSGLGLHRSTLGLLVLTVLFVPFALIGAFQVRFMELTDALVFSSVTVFLFLTSYFLANYVAEAPQERMRLIVRAYILSAVICALAGTLGYLGLIPGGEFLTRYGRAKGFFQDPNVFAPFLILPAIYALQRVLLGSRRRALWGGLIFMVILVGVFASFSRAAWGHMAASSLIAFVLCFALVANVREKARMIMIGIVGGLMVIIAIGGMLSIPAVERLFEERTATQSYDEGESGRFGRQAYAFDMALSHPLGVGPLEFSRASSVREEPHNTYVTVLQSYGWGGGLVFCLLVGITIWRGVFALTRASPNRLLLIPLVAVFVPLAIEAAIIDVDHWRHVFLVAGLIWGVTAGYQRARPGEDRRLAALV